MHIFEIIRDVIVKVSEKHVSHEYIL